jgi:phosphoserine aminotransferase
MPINSTLSNLRTHNFSAGPAALPLPVLQQAQVEMLNFSGTGMSVMEMSHRGKVFMEVAQTAEADFRKLLGISNEYAVLFLQGGGKGEFSFIPLNLLRGKTSADYVVNGHWSKGAAVEAAKYCQPNIIASSEDRNFTYSPVEANWKANKDAAFRHICSNETIHGVEIFDEPVAADGVPIVADMSSHILSRPINVSRYGCIYGGAQKNIGPSGLTFVIVRRDLLGGAHPHTPSVFDYTQQAKNDWMLNTPPTFAVYLAGLTFKWLLAQGGVAAIEQQNIAKAELLYNAIDHSNGFYRCDVVVENRSRMNVAYFMRDESLLPKFLEEAQLAGLSGLKGHKAVGGLRASIYNAVSLESVQVLVAFMRDFAQRNG